MTLDQVMKDWAMSHAPDINPRLYRGQQRKWTVKIEEVWASVDDAGNYFNSTGLDQRVEWTAKTLDTWKTATRTSWDMWVFNNKKEAEKFITVYHLTWAQ
jgi:hypothetical protein